jgi:hypothetical protein
VGQRRPGQGENASMPGKVKDQGKKSAQQLIGAQ